MHEFPSPKAYIAAYRTDPTLAAVPVPLVAEFLGISPGGVTQMLRSARLEGVRIKRTSMVLIRSLIAREEAFQHDVARVDAYIRELARKQVRHIFYEPVMEMLGLNWRIPADRTRIGQVLEGVSRQSAEQHRDQQLLLTVLVHRKGTGTTRPGPGFFTLAENIGHEWEDDDEFVRQHTDQVLAAYRHGPR